MSIALGEDFVLEIETATPGTFVPINGMDTWDSSDSQTIDTFPTFGATANPLAIPSPPDISYSASGFFDAADAGQTRARLLGQTRATGKIKVMYDGTNGYTQGVRIASRTHGASAQGGPQTQTFEFAPDGTAPVIVGTGPLP
jgi:hypothetical protein